jgi:CRISPR-associated endonuclease Csy4
MKYYLDITLLPDAETNLGFLWYKVYQQIHIMLVEHKVSEKDSAIALSFPKYGCKEFPLGDKLRLFAETKIQLENLKIMNWLNRLNDYVHIKAIKSVPDNITEHVYFKRKNFKSPEKLRQKIDSRAMAIAKKNGFDVDEVKRRLLASIDNLDTESKLPFINLRSLSTDKGVNPVDREKFLLFIECQKADKQSENKLLFNCYGLSRRNTDTEVTVPWFN